METKTEPEPRGKAGSMTYNQQYFLSNQKNTVWILLIVANKKQLKSLQIIQMLILVCLYYATLFLLLCIKGLEKKKTFPIRNLLLTDSYYSAQNKHMTV